MHLEHLVFEIKTIRFSDESSLSNGTLSIDQSKILSLCTTHPAIRLKEAAIVAPGQSVRLSPVLDIVEPRAPEEIEYSAFPGFLGKETPCETRRTHVLKGSAVLAVADLPGIQKGLVDMSPEAMPFCPFSETVNLVLNFELDEKADRNLADNAIRLATLKVAQYLGAVPKTSPADRIEKFAWPLPENDLPRLGLIYLVQSQGALRRTYLKGHPLDDQMPLLLNPLDVLEGALVSGNFVMPSNKTCTYIHQNQPLIREMLRRHGVDLNFASVVLANEMSRLSEKQTVVKEVLKLLESLDLAGVIINQEGGGNTLTDVMMLCRNLEDQGVETVLVLNEFAGADGKTPSISETTREAEHIISTGNNDYRLSLPPVETLIGKEAFPGLQDSLKKEIRVPLSQIHSSTNQLGFNRLSCREGRIVPGRRGLKSNRPLRVVHYVNQFFGQIGGENQAHAPLQVKEGPIGPGLAFKALFGEKAEIVATLVCGDNTVAENIDEISLAASERVADFSPDLFVAGPCFLAGRYGMACGAIAKAVGNRLGIPTVVGISESNPGVDVYRADTYLVPCGNSAAKMKIAVEAMVKVALQLALGDPPTEGTYLRQGIRQLEIMEASGAQRAVQMLVDKLGGRLPVTELPLPKFEHIEPAPPVKALSEATVVLGTEGGLTPKDNPDKIEMSMATRFGCYSIEGLASMPSDRFTVAHGGYDNTTAQKDPNRLVPLDVLRELEKEKVVGRVAPVFYTTAGNATSVENATRFGKEIAADIKRRFGENSCVVFTST